MKKYLLLWTSSGEAAQLHVLDKPEDREELARELVQSEQINSFDDTLMFADIDETGCSAFWNVDQSEYEADEQDNE